MTIEHAAFLLYQDLVGQPWLIEVAVGTKRKQPCIIIYAGPGCAWTGCRWHGFLVVLRTFRPEQPRLSTFGGPEPEWKPEASAE